jgi:hypothetical protein
MGVIEAVLALIGLAALVGMVVCWQLWQRPSEQAPPIEDDLAAPYREGLEAALRIQVVAQGLEKQMYAKAIEHAEVQSAPQRGVRYTTGTSTCTRSRN